MGSIYRRSSDKRWTAAISIGPRGKRRTIVRYAERDRNTKRRAEELLDELRRLHQPAVSAKTTTGEYLRSWLEGAGRRSLKASTWTTYDVALRRHIEPAIGHIKLARLTAGDVDAMLTGLELEAKGQRNVLGFLSRVLDVAYRRRLVAWNVARLVDRPRMVRAEQKVLTPAEARRLLEAVRGDRLEALWVAALGTGLRQAELLGLRWQDVDLEGATLTVVYTLTRVEGAYALDDTKTRGSRRSLALPAFVVDALREHRRRQLEERLAAGEPTAEGLVFVSPTGRPLNGGWVSHRWRILSRAAGLDVRFHDLRSTNATILRDRGVPEDVRMPRLGHVTPAMARQYAHPTETPDRIAARELDEALG